MIIISFSFLLNTSRYGIIIGWGIQQLEIWIPPGLGSSILHVPTSSSSPIHCGARFGGGERGGKYKKSILGALISWKKGALFCYFLPEENRILLLPRRFALYSMNSWGRSSHTLNPQESTGWGLERPSPFAQEIIQEMLFPFPFYFGPFGSGRYYYSVVNG